MPEANSAIGTAQAAKKGSFQIKIMLADVNAKILNMIKAGEIFGIPCKNTFCARIPSKPEPMKARATSR